MTLSLWYFNLFQTPSSEKSWYSAMYTTVFLTQWLVIMSRSRVPAFFWLRPQKEVETSKVFRFISAVLYEFIQQYWIPTKWTYLLIWRAPLVTVTNQTFSKADGKLRILHLLMTQQLVQPQLNHLRCWQLCKARTYWNILNAINNEVIYFFINIYNMPTVLRHC